MRSRFLISTARSSAMSIAIPAAFAALSAARCTPVGEGAGAAVGPLWIHGCDEGEDVGTIDAPVEFDLAPTFFAGEPIGDISGGPPQNRLIIRMQRNGNAIQINDILYFDIPNSFQVAQCVRGSTAPDVPPWDMGTGTIDPPGAVPITTPWCEPAGPAGFPRIHLVPFGPVRAALTPLGTCHVTAVGPTVVAVTGVAIDGWIDFRDFGGAAQTDVAPDMRAGVDDKFQVAYDDRLRADFHIVLGDDRVVTAMYSLRLPPPPNIGGTLDGFFDFYLRRGRSGQTFP
jgi:hypothetical protein